MNRAGQLRHRVMIQRMTPATDASGNRTESWEDFYACSAAISTTGGREFFEAHRVGADLSHELTVRYRDGIMPTMRVLYADPKNASAERYFGIRSVVNPTEQRRWLKLLCRELD